MSLGGITPSDLQLEVLRVLANLIPTLCDLRDTLASASIMKLKRIPMVFIAHPCSNYLDS